MTDAPNSVSEFGWRKPHPRRTPPPWTGRPTGGAGEARQLSTPIFFLQAAKRKRRWSRQKKKRLSLRSYGREAPCRAAGCGAKLSCSVSVAPARARAGLFAGFRTLYAVLHSEVIGQKSNLTSCSFRAFRFAKRCPGDRGGGPPFGMVLAPIPVHPSHPLAQTLRCAPLARVIDWAFRRARRLGVPFPSSFVGRPKPPSIVKRTDSHVGPLGLLGMTKV